MTPRYSTANRSTVMPISRVKITAGTHQGRSPSIHNPINAAPIRALSAIGSARVPNAVTMPRLRASAPSSRSVSTATTKIANAVSRQAGSCPSPTNSASRKMGTSTSRSTVSMLATLATRTCGTAEPV